MRKEVTVNMSQSMEATPIAHLVQLANQFASQIYFEMDTIYGTAPYYIHNVNFGVD